MRDMKTIICGSRKIRNRRDVELALAECPFIGSISEIVHGNAVGVDRIVHQIANDLMLPVKVFPVTRDDYNKFSRSAPIIRNQQMIDYADACIVIWDGVSSGTRSMIKFAKLKKLQLFIHKVNKEKRR